MYVLIVSIFPSIVTVITIWDNVSSPKSNATVDGKFIVYSQLV